MNPRDSASEALAADLKRMYAQPLPAKRTGALYNAFSYPTKIAPEAIALFIATHTAPGDTVLDTFAGSGTTGLAAKLCDCPTLEMKCMAAALEVSPVWGPRHAVLYELSGIGSFLAEVMCNPPDPQSFMREAQVLLDAASQRLAPLLRADDEAGNPGVLRHVIWSEVLRCPHCNGEHTFWDVAVERAPLRLRPADAAYPCPSCREKLTLASVPRAVDRVFDELIGREVEHRKRIPVRVYGKTGERKWQRALTPADHAVLATVADTPLPASVPVKPLARGDLYRSGYHFGLTHLHHLYTRRNLIVLSTLLELVEDRDARVRDALRLLVLSYNQSHATLMTRVVVKNGEADFVLTGAQSGVLYVSALPVEKNVLEGVARKARALRDAFAVVAGSRSTVAVHHASSTSLSLPDASVDYVFTDPPFGDYIPYSEINQVNELWLRRRTDCTQEAIVSAAQGKTADDYAALMQQVFCEMARVLKPAGRATVVFHSAKARIWSALQSAYTGAGLQVAATSVLDKLQASFKQVVSTVSVKGDPLLLLTKSAARAAAEAQDDQALIAGLLDRARAAGDPAEQGPQRLYSRYVAGCLERGDTVGMNAQAFYALVSQASAR